MRSKHQDVKKAESVVEEYLSDYQQKISDIEQYAREARNLDI